MKLAFLAGANSVHSERWITYFASRGHDVYWLALGTEAADNIKSHANINFSLARRSFFRPARLIHYAGSVHRFLREVKPDVFHVHQVWIDGILGALSRFHPLVITPWGSDVLIGPQSKLKRPLIRMALRTADLITCDGENTREAMVGLGIPARKIKIICFGVDVECFTPEPADRYLQKLLRTGNAPVVISMRTLSYLYDVETLIRACPLILKQIPDTKFVIVGEGDQRQHLISLAKELNIFDSLRFVGRISTDEIPKYLNLADVYVSTSLSDSGLAASTAEAMACELPVVVSDSGANRDWVRDGGNGFVVPAGNPAALAEKVIVILKNGGMKSDFGKINRKIIIDKNNYRKEMSLMETLYVGLCRDATCAKANPELFA